MPKIRIAVFCPYFYPHEGGLERYVYALFSDLKGIDVTIITANTENADAYEEKEGFKIYRLPCWHLLGGTYPVLKPSGLKILKSLKDFDYVITQTRFFNSSFAGLRFALKNKIRPIHFEHGTEHVKLKNRLFQFGAMIYDHIIGRYIIKNSWKAVGISEASEKFIRHLYNRETFLIRNSIDTKKFIMKKTDLKKTLGIQDEKVIVFVGRLIYAKGVQDLLEAAKEIPDVKVIIVGDGNYRSELKGKNAIFVGQKSQKEIAEYLSIADVFVNPSYAEGLPTSILEAGAVGVPVIATDVGGTKEIICDGKTGILIKPKDIPALRNSIMLLLKNKQVSAKMSKSLKEKIMREFDWDNARKKFLELLK